MSTSTAPLAATAKQHSAPGAIRKPCNLPKLWVEDPRLKDVRDHLDDVMTRIHDWGDLFDMVSFLVLLLGNDACPSMGRRYSPH